MGFKIWGGIFWGKNFLGKTFPPPCPQGAQVDPGNFPGFWGKLPFNKIGAPKSFKEIGKPLAPPIN